MTQTFHILEDQDRKRLREYLERLGETKVRLMSAVDCERYFGDWQVREEIDLWLDEKRAQPRPSRFGRFAAK
jgi:hypothetical protein